jgi:DNA (cytosine-5)-methyltransferase 1
MKKYKHLDLFSGIGGFSLGLEATGAFETVAFCDYDPYCQKVLRKHWPWVTIYDDVKELNSERLSANGHTEVDIITGGYPCQPFSIAGRQKGEQDPRHVWPEMFRLVKELRPTWVIGENVSGHIKLGLDTVLENLESEGYATRAFSISASSIGSNHQRERVWIIANTNELGWDNWIYNREERQVSNDKERDIEESESERDRRIDRIRQTSEAMEDTRCTQWPWSFFGDQNENETTEGYANQFERSGSAPESDVADTESVSSYDRTKYEHTQESDEKGQVRSEVGGINSDDAYTDIEGLEGRWSQCKLQEGQGEGKTSWSQWWQSEPNVGRVAHGVPKRVDRLKSLGNSLVPMIPYYIGMSIKKGDEIWTK